EAENAHDFERCIAMFAHPRYEIIATGEVWDGHSGVNALLQENKKGFPDFRFHPESFHHSAEAVIVEGRFTGTHSGNWRGLPPTGRKVDFRLILRRGVTASSQPRRALRRAGSAVWIPNRRAHRNR